MERKLSFRARKREGSPVCKTRRAYLEQVTAAEVAKRPWNLEGRLFDRSLSGPWKEVYPRACLRLSPPPPPRLFLYLSISGFSFSFHEKQRLANVGDSISPRAVRRARPLSRRRCAVVRVAKKLAKIDYEWLSFQYYNVLTLDIPKCLSDLDLTFEEGGSLHSENIVTWGRYIFRSRVIFLKISSPFPTWSCIVKWWSLHHLIVPLHKLLEISHDIHLLFKRCEWLLHFKPKESNLIFKEIPFNIRISGGKYCKYNITLLLKEYYILNLRGKK